MMFKTKEDVPDVFGPPADWKAAVLAATGKVAPNWSPTRYVPWTSWQSAASMWPNASGNTSIEAESSGRGVYAHEFSHNLGIADNYGNPYADNARREFSGAWDMMSRGSFNGPGGPHQRWSVPSVVGSQMGSQHMLRDKIKLNFVAANQVVQINRDVAEGPGCLGGPQHHRLARRRRRARRWVSTWSWAPRRPVTRATAACSTSVTAERLAV